MWKHPYLKKNVHVWVVFDYVETRVLNFAIEYLRENEKVHETFFACSYGVQVKSFKKKGRKSRDMVPLNSCTMYCLYLRYFITEYIQPNS